VKTLETERLLLRKFKDEDLDDLFEYAKLETVGPNAGWIPHPNKEHTQKILNHFVSGDDVWAMVKKDENKVIGSIGLHHTTLNNFGLVYELGYVMSTPYEGSGFMTEGVAEIINHAFTNIKLDKIYVGHFLENKRSEKLISRFNFKYLSDEEYASRDYGLKKSKIYVMTLEDYLTLGGKK